MNMRYVYLHVLLLLPGSLWAQQNYIYTNNDFVSAKGQNTVSGFSVDKRGALTELPGSPFLTGGYGGGGGYIASNRIIKVTNFLYAANSFSNDVSGFSIDPDTGTLTAVPGSPFPTGGVTGDGFSLAAASDGRFLYAAQDNSATIRTFGINPEDGSLNPIGNAVRARGGPNGMKVSPDGRWLAMVLTEEPPHGAVAVFNIDAKTGELTPVAGSPFPVRDPGGPEGRATGIDINCASDSVFVSEATTPARPTIVNVLQIEPDTGALTAIEGSPFMPGVGANSNVPLLSPDDSLLFVSNQNSYSITVFTVDSDGSLTLVPGSPFPASQYCCRGMATDSSGEFLYTTNIIPNAIHAFRVGGSAELTEVEDSPFLTGQPGIPLALAAYPGKTCPAQAK